MPSIAVLGATSWGTTLAWLLATNGHTVHVLTRSASEAAEIDRRRGLARLPEVTLPESVTITPACDFRSQPDGIVVAVPAQALAACVAEHSLPRSALIVSAAKGIELGTKRRMSEALVAAGWPSDHVAAISGPNLAHEVARGLPAASVVASANAATAATWQRWLSGHTFRVYSSTDIVGVEIGGATKNVIAIAAGAADGLGFGANTIAAIMTRGLAEMTRLGVALGADPLTFQGLAGVGDLAATCFSPLSRNRRLGELLAKGRSPAEAVSEIGEAVEGAATTPVALALARQNSVDLPIAEQVDAVLQGRATVASAMRDLLSRSLKPEARA